MIDKRRGVTLKLGNGDKLHKTIIESVECPKTGEKARFLKTTLLKQLAESPELLNCEGFDFETLSIKYSASRWIVETQVLEKCDEIN